MILLQRVNTRSERRIMKKHKFDIIIVISLIFVAAVSWVIINNIYQSKGSYIEIIVNEKVKDTLPLNKDTEYRIAGKNFLNVIKIKDGQAYMEAADCPDELCVKQGKISKNGQAIICLPHKVVVRVVSEDDSGVDANTN